MSFFYCSDSCGEHRLLLCRDFTFIVWILNYESERTNFKKEKGYEWVKEEFTCALITVRKREMNVPQNRDAKTGQKLHGKGQKVKMG